MAEEKLVEIYAQGRVPGHIHSGVGEEAAYVGPLMTRNETDYYKGTHRVVSAVHAVGVTFNEIFAEILGKQTGTSHGRGGVNHIARLDKGVIVPPALGVDTEVAIGAGLSAKYLENGRIVYCYNGDGTHSRGNVHEAMNMAAIWKLPVLFIVKKLSTNSYAKKYCPHAPDKEVLNLYSLNCPGIKQYILCFYLLICIILTVAAFRCMQGYHHQHKEYVR